MVRAMLGRHAIGYYYVKLHSHGCCGSVRYFVITGSCVARADVPMPSDEVPELPLSLLPGTGNA